jgi:hypothetical protein
MCEHYRVYLQKLQAIGQSLNVALDEIGKPGKHKMDEAAAGVT